MDGWRWAAHALGLVPILTMAGWGRRLPSAWWWLAVAFGVSFLADTVSVLIPGPRGVGHQLVSQTYPLLQAGLFALVLAPRPLAVAVIGQAAIGVANHLILVDDEQHAGQRAQHRRPRVDPRGRCHSDQWQPARRLHRPSLQLRLGG